MYHVFHIKPGPNRFDINTFRMAACRDEQCVSLFNNPMAFVLIIMCVTIMGGVGTLVYWISVSGGTT